MQVVVGRSLKLSALLRCQDGIPDSGRTSIPKARPTEIELPRCSAGEGPRTQHPHQPRYAMRVTFQRVSNAIRANAFGSHGKAVAAAASGRPSGELTKRAHHPTPAGIAAAAGGHMIMGQGAMPILRDGIAEGVCGVGVGTRGRTRTARGPALRNHKGDRHANHPASRCEHLL
jgi:hypothetical protein